MKRASSNGKRHIGAGRSIHNLRLGDGNRLNARVVATIQKSGTGNSAHPTNHILGRKMSYQTFELKSGTVEAIANATDSKAHTIQGGHFCFSIAIRTSRTDERDGGTITEMAHEPVVQKRVEILRTGTCSSPSESGFP
jgi:hypothetical protein